MIDSLKISIEYLGYVDKDRSYLIINDEETDDKFVITGEKAERISDRIDKLIKDIIKEEA